MISLTKLSLIATTDNERVCKVEASVYHNPEGDWFTTIHYPNPKGTIINENTVHASSKSALSWATWEATRLLIESISSRD